MKKVFITSLAFASFSAMACATIFTGTKDTISFNTNPSRWSGRFCKWN
ncbi:MAG TPA: hypothetical protein VFQ86_03430 [Arachidicoccus soli]|nr:hypothetical protein [Arachidicoccus soli]